MTSLETRSAVRNLLTRELGELIGGDAAHTLPPELSDLATSSDREVIESLRRLDKSCDNRSGADAKGVGAAMGQRVRDLFAKALERMKQLPPDPRETLHAQPAAPTPAAPPSHKRRTRR